MSYGQFHPLPPKPPKEKWLLNLSIDELVIMVIGVLGAEKILTYIPPLPINNLVFARIHAVIPLGIAALFAFGKHPKTNLSITKEIFNWIRFKYKNRVLVYKKGG